MKNQYFGDINDYRKYGLIRCIINAGNFRILVAWMLTPDDGSTDGKLTQYLSKPDQWQNFDPELYKGIQALINSNSHRKVELIEHTNLLPNAKYFSDIVPDTNVEERTNWTQKLIDISEDANLIFIDPDNGIEVNSKPYGRKHSSKFLYWREINDLWSRGKSLLVYQHFRREKRQVFIRRMLHEFQHHTDGSFVEAFSTPNVVFFLALQPQHQLHHPAIVKYVQKNWGSQIQHWE
jgi:hypothetical protein